MELHDADKDKLNCNSDNIDPATTEHNVKIEEKTKNMNIDVRTKEDHNVENNTGENYNIVENGSKKGQENEDSDSDDEAYDAQRLLASLELSADTMKALNEFMQEEEERQTKLEQISEGNIPIEFEENWNMSQFWYSNETAESLAHECLRVAAESAKRDDGGLDAGGAIACIASPTVYRALSKMKHNAKVNVLEFDTRFAVYGEDFVLYDFRSPLSVPKNLHEKFDVLLLDPPYLKEDCLTKVALTVKYVAKPGAKIILCTGLVMQDLAYRLMNLKPQKFAIKHEKDRLSNPFGCFANYDLDEHCKY